MEPSPDPVLRNWLNSDLLIPTRFIRPTRRFMETEASGGFVLLLGALAALAWANSPWSQSYVDFFATRFDLQFGPFHLDESVKELINDGLMAIFFFVVGMEIKRELVVGELNEPRKAALPALAAVGGMAVPALIYLAFVAGTGSEGGEAWGIPMATDIAFSIGVVALLGTRISTGAKLFLLALAIVDDVGAIVVVAFFYTTDINAGWLVVAVAALVLLWWTMRVGVRYFVPYMLLGIVVWFAFLESGVHATIAGVVLGLLTSVRPLYSEEDFHRRATWILDRWDMNRRSPEFAERMDHDALELAVIARESVAPLTRLEHSLHLWSSFFIVPLFALANAGVRFVDLDLGEAVVSPVALGVAVGLALGKPVGITLATWLGLKLNLGRLPRRTSMRHIVGLGLVAGIGFTVSLFITELAFPLNVLGDQAKIGIFLGSTVAGTIGFVVLRAMRSHDAEVEEARHALGAGTGE